MDVWDIAFLLVRLVHGIAAAIWVGGGLVMLLVIAPRSGSIDSEGATSLSSAVARRFGRFFGGAIGVFIITGGVMTFERLAQPGLTSAYGLILGLKIALAFLAFGLVWRGGAFLDGWEARPISSLVTRMRTSRAGLAVITGVVIYALSALLGFLFERNLSG